MTDADLPLAADLQRRLREVLEEEYGLSPFSAAMLEAWLPRIFEDSSGDQCLHVRRFLWSKLSKRQERDSFPLWQRRCPELVPNLTSRPTWTPDDHPCLAFVREVEANFGMIRDEVLAMRRGSGSTRGFQPYRAPSWSTDGSAAAGTDSGDWNVFYFQLHGMDFSNNLARCPVTAELVQNIPRSYCHAMLSALAPGTHVAPHTGPTNKKLRIHLPLVVPGQDGTCRIRVGEVMHSLREGECFIFDDSFEHEAWNDHSTEPRLVLIFDVWHPDLADEEVKFFSFLLKAELRRARKAAEACLLSPEDDFHALIRANHERGGVDAAAVFGDASTP